MADSFTCSIRSWHATDGYRGYYRRFDPPTACRGLICILHGIQSHGGWYIRSSEFWAQHGFRVIYLDRRGSGMNFHQRGDTPHYSRLTEDVLQILQQEQLPDVPCFLVGTSWGAKTTAHIASQSNVPLAGVVFLCPGFVPKVRPPFLTSLQIAWSWLINPKKQFPIPLSDPNLFTQNPKWLEFLRNDGLALHTASARLLINSVLMDRQVRGWLRTITCPTLLVLAGKDRIIQNESTRELMRMELSAKFGLLEFPEAHHTLEFEDDGSWMSRLLDHFLSPSFPH